jgi:hypothetical protein
MAEAHHPGELLPCSFLLLFVKLFWKNYASPSKQYIIQNPKIGDTCLFLYKSFDTRISVTP